MKRTTTERKAVAPHRTPLHALEARLDRIERLLNSPTLNDDLRPGLNAAFQRTIDELVEHDLAAAQPPQGTKPCQGPPANQQHRERS